MDVLDAPTLMFGRILALYLLTAGIGFLVATPFYAELTRRADRSDAMAVNISGMVHLFIGFVIVVNHFLWDSLLAGLVTLLGIVFVVRGAAYFWVPQLVVRPSTGRAAALRSMGGAFVAVGLLMGYLSFAG
ncbi:hypothetical protein [Mycolicibacterium palauense]|uniref:hypothetical protein n=1 Tax=Mycolicibacterium palauense TaxID=2034511 RepID=UPI001C3F3D2F|nr:hypothetical protein [Mycolicibacterium palauense]